tara:strand:- start:443 stop:2119 length:1677 start_codon:yes stop_codon:yes gene_type:complete
MDWQKTIFIIGMAVSAWLLAVQWNQFNIQQDLLEKTATLETQDNQFRSETDFYKEGVSTTELSNELPTITINKKETAPSPVINYDDLIKVTTKTLEVYIDPSGGDIVRATLLQHFDALSGTPITLLNNTEDNLYLARSGIIGKNGTDTVNGRPKFYSNSKDFNILDGTDIINVDLFFSENNIDYIKRFTFSDDSYVIEVSYFINNNSSQNWSGIFYGQIKRDSNVPSTNARPGLQAFLGAAIREPDKNFAKYEFNDIEEDTVKVSINGGWLSMVQLYFISAWIPPVNNINEFSLRKLSNKDEYIMSFTSEPVLVPSGGASEYSSKFYVGPKDQEALASLAEYLDLTIDYGPIWMIAKPIFFLMQLIERLIGNWGWAIVCVTALVRLALYPLTRASARSMATMRKLQPQLTSLKELHADDKQKFAQEQMALFKREKVNPLGGCLPIILQMPVFFAMYFVILESVEIRHEPWILWIQDLSAHDPLYILPVLMGISLFLMQKSQPAPPDPMVAKVFKFMPIGFVAFTILWDFPSGLVLYWTATNIFSIGQQYVVNKQLKIS